MVALNCRNVIYKYHVFYTIITYHNTGHAVSMINDDQCRSMPDQICGIETNADQYISMLINTFGSMPERGGPH